MGFRGLFCVVIVLAAGAVAAPELLDDSAIAIESVNNLQQTRAALVKTIWKDAGFPSQNLPEVIRGVDMPFPELAEDVAAVDKLVYPMEMGMRATAYLLHPTTPRNRLAVFHQGHGHGLLENGGADTMRFFLEEGYDVIAHWMPLFGPNKHEGYPAITSHDTLMKEADEVLSYHPLKFFLEPVIAGLNHALAQQEWEEVVMIGISGGGWTTTMIAALDPRVALSFPVAGTMPLYTRSGGSIGDREQYAEEIYSVAGYPDLYVLGAHGEGRKQVQILNHEDPCCFAVKEEPAYVAEVQARLKALGPGEFVFHIDTSHGEHKISEHALKAFVKPALGE